MKFGDIGSQRVAEAEQFGIAGEIAFYVTQHSRNVCKKFRIVLDPVDVDETSGRFEIALDAHKIEHAPKV